jgi:hypothetical protein
MKMAKKKTPVKSIKTEPKIKPAVVKSKRNFVLALIGIVIFLAFGYWFFRGVLSNKTINRKMGIVTGCVKSPTFVNQLGFTNKAAFSTSERNLRGLAIIEPDKKPYQHDSWKSAGFLAPIQLSQNGDVFVAPAPTINVLENPILEQNTLYKVDGKTQEMKPFAKLPVGAKTSDQNPFGLLGLGYDCETGVIYASSVFGSTRLSEIGSIFAIDEKTGSIRSELKGIDGFGLTVFNSAKGKRLYYGLARIPEIWSVGINENGEFISDPKREISLEGLGQRGDDKSRKIRFTAQNELIVTGIEFNFNLIAPTEKQEAIYRFIYDSSKDSFSLIQNN